MVDSSDVGPRRNLGASENWGRWNDERVTFAIRELEDLKVNLNGTARSIDGVAGGMAGISQTIIEGTAKPVPPSNTRITSNVSTWTSERDAAAKVIVEWDAVGVGTAGEPVNVIGYEVWVHNQSNLERGSYIAEALTGLKATLTLPVEIDATITTRAQGSNGVWSDHSNPVKVTTAPPPSPIPKAPTNLTLVSNTPGWSPIGLPVAELSFTWDAVTKAIDNTNIGIARYELWEGTATDMGHPVRSVVTLEADVVLDSKSEATYRARACSSFGIWSDFSNVVPVIASVPPVDMTPPSNPTTVSGLATIEVKWDGLLVGPVPPPSHIANVLAYESASASGPWVLTGPPLKIGGAITVRADKGVTRWFRFQTIDTLGRLGGVSAAVSGVAVGVTLPDVDQTITDAIEQAQQDAADALATVSTMDGKITTSPDAPTAATGAGKPVGALWFRTSSGGKIIGLWDWSGTVWNTRQLDDATVANLSAAKIDTGILNSARIGTKSLTAEKVVLASLGNLIPNGNFADGGSGWYGSVPDGSEWTTKTVPDGPTDGQATVLEFSPTTTDRGVYSTAFPASTTYPRAQYIPGATYHFKLTVRRISGAATGTGGIRIRLGLHGEGQTNNWPVVPGTHLAINDTTDGAWVTMEGDYTMPIDNPRNLLSVAIHASNAANSVYEISEVSMMLMASAELIVDGSVTARKVNVEEFFANEAVINAATIAVLRVGVIEASMLSSGVGENLDITSNSSITLLAGQAANTQGQVDALQTYLRVDGTGLTLGATGNPLQAQMRPGAFAILDNGIETTYWESGRMVVPSLVTEEVVLSNHKAEKYGTGTVWRTT